MKNFKFQGPYKPKPCKPRISSREARELYKERAKSVDHTEINNLTNIVAKVFEISPERIRSKRKFKDQVESRQTAMFFARKLDYPLWFVGHYYNKDHSTVVHAMKCVLETLPTEKGYNEKYQEVLNKVFIEKEVLK